MVYIPFNDAVPAGTETPPNYAVDDLANIRALRDGVVSGFMPGWSFAWTVAVPYDVMTWSKGVYRLRARLNWDNVALQYIALVWEWSDNSGAAFVNINTGGTPATITHPIGNPDFDKDASILAPIVAAIEQAVAGQTMAGDHAALNGTAVHGLGTLSTQNANAAAITDGSIAGAIIAKRLTQPNVPTLATGAALDWAARPLQSEIAAGATINGMVNALPGEMKRVLVIGGGAVTINPGAGNTFNWATGHPVWGANYTVVNIIARNATTFIATTIPV